MADPETPTRRISPPALRLAASSSEDAKLAVRDGPLEAMLEKLGDLRTDRAAIAELLRQRLGDARTLALLAHGETASAAGALLAHAAREAADAVRRSLAERPEDAAGRLACVRAGMRFGQVLLAQGLVAPRRLEVALEAQKSSARRIGEELAAEGHISPREVAEALWLQHKLAAAALALLVAEATRSVASPRLVHSSK